MATKHRCALELCLLMLIGVAPTAGAAASVPPRLEAEKAWVYKQTVESDGKVTEEIRSEVSTGWSNRAGNWVAFIRTGAATPAADAPAPVARMHGLIDGHGCMTDLVSAKTLQERPCTGVPAPGSTWANSQSDGQQRVFKVTGSDDIRIALGTFEATRVEEVDSMVLVVGDNVRQETQTSRTVYWYVPQLGAMARVERDFLRPDGSIAMRQIEVLESFGAMSAEARLAARATPQWQAFERAQAIRARIATLNALKDALARPARMTGGQACRPDYPPAAIRAQATGVSRVVLVVGADGAVEGSDLVGASGPTREHQLLDAAAQDSLARCTFVPAQGADGTPTASTVVISYTWKLE